MIQDKKSKLFEQIKLLKNIPNFAETKTLRKRLQKELTRLTKSPSKQKSIQKTNTSKTFVNQRRSVFMKNTWRYVKLMLDTYPQLREKHTARDIFVMYFARRRGEDVTVGDVMWQNPSLPADSSQ